MNALLYLAAFLGLGGGLIFWVTLTDTDHRRVRARLLAITGASHGKAGRQSVFFGASGRHLAALERRFEIIGWNMARVLLAGAGGLVLLFGFIVLLAGVMSASLATLIAVAAMIKGLNVMAERARTRFADDLPLVVDRLRQLIIAGNGMTLAFNKALRICPPRLTRLLSPVALAVEHGMSLPEALHQRAVRLASPDLFLLAAITRTSTQFGGDFSTALKHFETILQNRIRSRREIRALTSELRMTTFILLSLPLVTAAGIFFANRQYIEFFITAPQGLPALIYVGGSISVGVLLVSRLSRIEF